MKDWGENLELKISRLPDSPGCYLMKDAAGTIIYVGKAVNLKNRVRSYFRETEHTPKVAAMIAHIADFDVLLCESNLEALCLECNLIKRHLPYYNILLKDDKHYPYICVNLKEPFPRITMARRREKKDGCKYFGPYTGTTVIGNMLNAARDIFPLRTCKLSLPLKTPRRPCINHEIGRCLAPCAGKCTEEAYWDMLDGALSFLGGSYKEVTDRLTRQMMEASAAMQYERAAILRDKIKAVNALAERQIAIRTDEGESDVLAVAGDGVDALVQLLYIRGGRMVGGDHFILPREGGEEPSEVLAGFLTQYYEDDRPVPRHVLCQDLPEESRPQLEEWLREKRGAAVTLAVPRRGEKHDLVLLAEKNARDALEKRNARAAIRAERTTGAAETLGRILGLPKAPRRIEGFDISNTQGDQNVASMVVFIGGEPASKEYRRFRIKSFEGANDFAAMNEVLGRRFREGLAEKAAREAAGQSPVGGKFSDLPDLVLVDGGPQQLRFAREALRALGAEVAIFGLAKQEEAIFLPDREEPILLAHNTPELQLIQRVRDEAHRFAITYHRELRGKAALHSALDDIPGIGPTRRRALLRTFGSLEKIRRASVEELRQVKGMNQAAAEAVAAWAKK